MIYLAMESLDQFLMGVQNRAFLTAKLATRSHDEALDLVQDSMFRLAQKYANESPEAWPGLFQTILQNTIKDWYRRQKVRRILYWWQQYDKTEEELEVVDEAHHDLRDRASRVLSFAFSGLFEFLVRARPEPLGR